MRDRLIELLEEAKTQALATVGSLNHGFGEWYADYLLANGVIVPPVKVGQTVWVCNHHNGNVYENRVDGIFIAGASGWKNTVRLKYKNRLGEVQYRKFVWKQIGKSVFLTKSQAEEALKNEQEKL